MITDLQNNSLATNHSPLFVYYHISTNKLFKVATNVFRLLDQITINNIKYYQFGDIYTNKRNCKILMARIDNRNTKACSTFVETIINNMTVLKPESHDKQFANLAYVFNNFVDKNMDFLVINKNIIPRIAPKGISLFFNKAKVKWKTPQQKIYYVGDYTKLTESPNPWYQHTKSQTVNIKHVICCIVLLLLFIIILHKTNIKYNII